MEWQAVQDSGARREFGTGSVRDVRTGKGRYDLIAPYALERLAKHYENGAVKYGDRNWELGQPLMGYIDSALRHINKYVQGSREEDHMAAAAWNIFSFIQTQKWIEDGILPEKLNDIPTYPANTLNSEKLYELISTAKASYPDVFLMSDDSRKSFDTILEQGQVYGTCGHKLSCASAGVEIITEADEGIVYQYLCPDCAWDFLTEK